MSLNLISKQKIYDKLRLQDSDCKWKDNIVLKTYPAELLKLNF